MCKHDDRLFLLITDLTSSKTCQRQQIRIVRQMLYKPREVMGKRDLVYKMTEDMNELSCKLQWF
jgi:hypothetical protein